MKTNTIKLSESALRQLVAESVKGVIKEISLKTIEDAEEKSGGWNTYTELNKGAGYDSRVHKAIDRIEEELEYYAYDLGNGQAKGLLKYLDPIRDFFNRKGEQASNFTSAREGRYSGAKAEMLKISNELFPEKVSGIEPHEGDKVWDVLTDDELREVLRRLSPESKEVAALEFGSYEDFEDFINGKQ